VSTFAARYGRWALVAGASEGIGAAFATALAGRGLDLVLVARRAGPLAELAARLPTRTVTVAADLSAAGAVQTVASASEGLDIGLVVANAAYAPTGAFLTTDPWRSLRALDLNCRAPLLLAHHYLPAMCARGRGGLIIMSSLAGQQGSPGIATYAATKAFGAVLAEGLWSELRGTGVDVLACVAGAVATPGLARAKPGRAPGTVTPDAVAGAALRALGRRPRTVPGGVARVSAALMSRLLPRTAAIQVIARASRDLSG
jgi:short-subunit dehydrogenase